MNLKYDIVITEDPHLDQGPLETIRALQRPGQPDLLTRIIDTYLESASELIETMRRSLLSDDRETLGHSALTLKSSAANLGAMQLCELCRQLEADVAEGRLEDADSLLAAICRAHQLSSDALRRERVGG